MIHHVGFLGNRRAHQTMKTPAQARYCRHNPTIGKKNRLRVDQIFSQTVEKTKNKRTNTNKQTTKTCNNKREKKRTTSFRTASGWVPHVPFIGEKIGNARAQWFLEEKKNTRGPVGPTLDIPKSSPFLRYGCFVLRSIDQ